jgi:ribosomal protein L23
MFTVDANKHHIKQAVKELCDTDVVKVNTLVGPGEKARGPLASDSDTL